MDDPSFKDADEEYQFHLVRAEHHIQRALDLLSTTAAPKRSTQCRALLHRAHGIVFGLYFQESRRKKEKKK